MDVAYFAVLPYQVRYSKEIGSDEKLLYAEITARLNYAGYCTTPNKTFADLFNREIRTISIWMANLKNAGFIRIVQDNKKHRRLLYPKYSSDPSQDVEGKDMPEKVRKFHEAFPDGMIDTFNVPDEVDMDKLIEGIMRNKFLREKARNWGLKSCIAKYKAIINDHYKSFDSREPSTSRYHTKEELNSLFQNVDEIEI